MSNTLTAFAPSAQSVTFTANASAPSAVLPLCDGQPSGLYRISNTGTVHVHVGFGPTASIAQTNAADPLKCITVQQNSANIFFIGGPVYFSGSATTACVVYVNQGISA